MVPRPRDESPFLESRSMKHSCAALLCVLFPVVFAAACSDDDPVATPTSATSVAPPEKAAVSSTTPRLMAPTAGITVPYASQPVRLVVTNAVSTAPTAPTYTFQVATDEAFSSVVYARDGVAPGANGQTELTIDRLAGSAKYYWRALIVAAGENGPLAAPSNFTVGPQVVIQAPSLLSPGANESVGDQPTLTVGAAQRTGPAGDLFYRFEVSEQAGFNSIAYSAVVQERAGVTSVSHTVGRQLEEKTYYWRAFASSPSNEANGPFSATGSFRVTKTLDIRTAKIEVGPANVANWEETGKITSAYFANGQLCIFHTRLGVWPATLFASDGTLLEGNQWVFAKLGDVWYGGAADWYKPGQACKDVDEGMGHDAFYLNPSTPLKNWVPRSGETIGVMSSTPARMWPMFQTYDERTDVVMIKWP